MVLRFNQKRKSVPVMVLRLGRKRKRAIWTLHHFWVSSDQVPKHSLHNLPLSTKPSVAPSLHLGKEGEGGVDGGIDHRHKRYRALGCIDPQTAEEERQERGEIDREKRGEKRKEGGERIEEKREERKKGKRKIVHTHTISLCPIRCNAS